MIIRVRKKIDENTKELVCHFLVGVSDATLYSL
jgi:hypothetical protein